jgi:DnaK suppressor protein
MTLTSRQRDHLERRLREERARVLRDLNRLLGVLSDTSGQTRPAGLSRATFQDADVGSGAMEQELIASNASRQSRELADIDAALDRLRRTPDRFGVCEDTGEAIPFERLDVLPWARTVIRRAA